MDCYTKQRGSGCQNPPPCGRGRQDIPMGPGPVVRPDAVMGPGPVIRPDMVMGPGPVIRPEMGMGPGPVIRPEMGMGPGPVIRSDMGLGAGQSPIMPPEMMRGTVPCENIDQFPVAMAYVPWQRWQQVYPVERAIGRGTIFPDLDKPFGMGRCR